jgi:hypothetical protein
MSESQTPSLSEVIEAGVDERLENFVSAIPVNVLRWNSVANTVDIEVAIVNAHERPDGELEWHRAKLYDVPVLFPGSGKNRMTFPLAVNSAGLYIVSTLPTDDYRVQGTDTRPSRTGVNVPGSARNNICNGGYFIPGLYYRDSSPPKASEVDVVIYAEDKIRLGGIVGTSPLALESTLTQFMSVLSSVTDPSGACAALHAALVLIGWPGSFTSDKVESK